MLIKQRHPSNASAATTLFAGVGAGMAVGVAVDRSPRSPDLSTKPGSRRAEEPGDEDAVSIHAQMEIVRQDGLRAARHLVEDIYEVEAHGVDNSYRLLFSTEGSKGRILLAVVLHESTRRRPRNT
jgi:hypothetical protein